MITILDKSTEDFADILIMAERYALGRRTYAVREAVDFIKLYLDYLPERALIVLERDISNADNYGDDNIDKPIWMELLSDIRNELNGRKQKPTENI